MLSAPKSSARACPEEGTTDEVESSQVLKFPQRDAADTAYDLVMKADEAQLQQAPEWQQLLAEGLSPKDARNALAIMAARKGSVIPALIGAVSGTVGAERLLAGAGGKAGSRLAQAGKAGAVEGVSEAVEEGATQYSGAKAAEQFDPSIDPTKGVAGAAAAPSLSRRSTAGVWAAARA